MRIPVFIVTLTFLFGARPAAAQSTMTRTWLGGGVGVAAPVEDRGDLASALSLNLSHQRSAHVFTLRVAAAFEVWGDDYFDAGLLYGRGLRRGATSASAGAGLGVVFGTRTGGLFGGGAEESIGPTIGIPLEAQLFVRILPFLGIGAYGFANANAERHLLGAAAAVQIGDLR